MSTLLLVPLDDIVVFPNMNVTISADVADEERVLLVPRHDGEYAKVGTVAEVAERVRLPGGVGAVQLIGLHRGIAGAAHTDVQGRLRVEVQEQPDVEPAGVKTRELEREYRAVVEEILELRGDDGRISAFVRSIGEVGTLADTAAYAPEITFEQRIELLEAVDAVERLELALRFSVSAWPNCRSGSGSATMSRRVLSASSASTSCAVSWSRSARSWARTRPRSRRTTAARSPRQTCPTRFANRPSARPADWSEWATRAASPR